MDKRTIWIEKALAAVLVRMVWFAGAFAFLVFAHGHSLARSAAYGESVPLFLFLAVIAGGISLVGPVALSKARYRASGKLSEIKAMSKTPEKESARKNIPVAKPRR